jgi:hypothetical protein
MSRTDTGEQELVNPPVRNWTACPKCEALSDTPKDESQFSCTQCGGEWTIRECPRCAKYMLIPPELLKGPHPARFKCRSCSKVAVRRKFRAGRLGETDVSTGALADFYASFGLSILDVAEYPGRRCACGVILSSEGLSGLLQGACSIYFDETAVHMAVGSFSNGFEVPLSEVTSLIFSGRGQFATKTGGRIIGGGFGLQGAAEGILVARALNALSATTVSRIESVVTLQWLDGGIVLQNNCLTPQELASQFTVVTEAIRSNEAGEQQSSRGDLPQQIHALAQLHGSGALTDAEFSAAKARLLESP